MSARGSKSGPGGQVQGDVVFHPEPVLLTPVVTARRLSGTGPKVTRLPRHGDPHGAKPGPETLPCILLGRRLQTSSCVCDNRTLGPLGISISNAILLFA